MAKKKTSKGEEPKKVRVAGLKGGERVRAVEGVGKLKLAQEIKEEEKKPSRWRRPRVRGKRYLAARAQVDRTKLYPIKEAVALARRTSIARFGGSLELHLVVKKTGASFCLVSSQVGSTGLKTFLSASQYSGQE